MFSFCFVSEQLPQKACDVFRRMKREGIKPSVVSYSALVSASEKGGQWKLALEILDEMKEAGYVGNVVAYSAAISALAKGQQWEKALELFREIQSNGGHPSIVTYNATMTALEKSLEWERALDMFDEMKSNNLPITVVSYGCAISACDKGLQYRQCLEFLDEMTEMGIQKNVIIFGAAMSCMEKCCRADIGFQLMERIRIEGIQPNVHVYNSAISACARCNLWEKGHELFLEMEERNVRRDVVTYNATLDAVASQIELGRSLFEEGVKKGFYARVSRLGEQWFELDLHFLSLGGGEIALGWWFEKCLVPYLNNTDTLKTVKSISIVTGYGKTRTRGRRYGDDGMRKRCKAMLQFMNIKEIEQSNAGRIHVDKEALIEEVNRNNGRVIFDLAGYIRWKETETTANVVPEVPQKVRPRFKPVNAGSGRPPFIRLETESTSPEYRLENLKNRPGFLHRPPPEQFQQQQRPNGSGSQTEQRIHIGDDTVSSHYGPGRGNGQFYRQRGGRGRGRGGFGRGQGGDRGRYELGRGHKPCGPTGGSGDAGHYGPPSQDNDHYVSSRDDRRYGSGGGDNDNYGLSRGEDKRPAPCKRHRGIDVRDRDSKRSRGPSHGIYGPIDANNSGYRIDCDRNYRSPRDVQPDGYREREYEVDGRSHYVSGRKAGTYEVDDLQEGRRSDIWEEGRYNRRQEEEQQGTRQPPRRGYKL